MDPNDGNNESVNDALISAVAEANHETYQRNGTPDKANTDPAATGAQGGGTPTKQKESEADPEDSADNIDGHDTQDFSHEVVPSIEKPADTTEESAKETPLQTETQTPDTEFDWKASLPQDPGEFEVQPPQADEDGRIDPDEYAKYLEDRIDYKNKLSDYNKRVTDATFDAVERILPEFKDNQAYQVAIRNTFQATGDGNEAVELAKQFRATLDQTTGAAKAAGAQNAKVSIEVQKNATVESQGATQKQSTPDPLAALDARLSRNDKSAQEELMGRWLSEGKI